MVRACILSMAFALLAGQDKKAEVDLKWGLAKDQAAEYSVSQLKGGKPVPLKDRFFVVYGSELLEDGTSSLMVNSYDDIGPTFLFHLPPGTVKAGAKWKREFVLFKDARQAAGPEAAFREMSVQGQFHFKKVEKVQDVDCAMIEGVLQYFEVKLDSKKRKVVGRQPSGQICTMQWLSLENTQLVRGSYEVKGKAQEFQGVNQGFEPRPVKTDRTEMIELKKDLLRLELKEQFQRINDAIKKGVEYLTKSQDRSGGLFDKNGSYVREHEGGSTALALMALLHSGVKPDDPLIRRGVAFVQSKPFKFTYDVALTLMLLETKHLPLEQYRDLEELTEEKAREAVKRGLTPEDKVLAEKAAKWLIDKQTKDGTWGYPEFSETLDHSNTQYALLGLKSAARMGVFVPESVWRKAADHWIASQRVQAKGPQVELKVERFGENGAPAGGTKGGGEKYGLGPWGYRVNMQHTTADLEIDPTAFTDIIDNGYGSMTCAGFSSLVIAESELVAQKGLDARLAKDLEKAKNQGLAWLQENYSIRGGPPAAGWWSLFYMYYLYGLERVMVLHGIRKLGGHDWYLEGAILLAKTQCGDGSWATYAQLPVVDTSFALLFLKKATVRVSTGAPR
jgi:hypothetical protein